MYKTKFKNYQIWRVIGKNNNKKKAAHTPFKIVSFLKMYKHPSQNIYLLNPFNKNAECTIEV
jgi:hypothetical protein